MTEKGGLNLNTHCQYCGCEVTDGAAFCSEECAETYRQMTSQSLRNLKGLFIGLAISLFVIIWGPVTRNEQMVGIGVAMLGFVVAKWPLTTPETVRALGYVPSREICRAIGVTVIPLGLVTTFFM